MYMIVTNNTEEYFGIDSCIKHKHPLSAEKIVPIIRHISETVRDSM